MILRFGIARIVALTICLLAWPAFADSEHCGPSGVWIQILGAGSGELDDLEAGPSYLVWIDDHARLLVNAGPAALLRFEEAGADLADLDAVVFNQLGATYTVDFPAFLAGARGDDRRAELPVFGPPGSANHPGTQEWLERLIGASGAFPDLAGSLDRQSNTGFAVISEDVAAVGPKIWSGFANERFELSALSVNHGDKPALAWRINVDNEAIVFAGAFNNERNRVARFAANADTIVFHHAVPQSARGLDRDLHVLPSQIGKISEQAGLRFAILSHRSSRTRGVESLSRASIEENFKGDLIFANDLECWGL
ncbi:MAG: hypothetical protein NXH85_18215 [Pseudomonadaceae bacterium]|nr:hypothetical protein [Pseudomonadaceae bacterium]